MKSASLKSASLKSDFFYKFNFGISSFCLTLVATLCINPICTNAAEITINDCNGVTRAQIVLADQAERKDITVGLINKEIENKLSQIKNVLLKSGSEVVASEVNDGQAYFHNLNSGVYEICPESASTRPTCPHRLPRAGCACWHAAP